MLSLNMQEKCIKVIVYKKNRYFMIQDSMDTKWNNKSGIKYFIKI